MTTQPPSDPSHVDVTGTQTVTETHVGKCWWQNGVYHREDGPAVERFDGSKFWILHGDFHRVDGPALEHSNGDREWYVHGMRHRNDGPAVMRSNAEVEWWFNGWLCNSEIGYCAALGLTPQETTLFLLKWSN